MESKKVIGLQPCKFYQVSLTFQDHQTPLHFASDAGHSEVVQLLISHGATVDMKDSLVSSIESVY